MNCCQNCCQERGQLPTRLDKPWNIDPAGSPLLDGPGPLAHASGSEGWGLESLRARQVIRDLPPSACCPLALPWHDQESTPGSARGGFSGICRTRSASYEDPPLGPLASGEEEPGLAVDEFAGGIQMTGVGSGLADHVQQDLPQVVQVEAGKEVRPPGGRSLQRGGGDDLVG